MTNTARFIMTAVGLVLVFAGGVTFMTTTIPGIALIAAAWGLKSK